MSDAEKLSTPLSTEELDLVDKYAGLAMRSLLAIGTIQPEELTSKDGKRTFEFPDSPYYFGHWEGDYESTNIQGVYALASDAYEVGLAMIKVRREIRAAHAQLRAKEDAERRDQEQAESIIIKSYETHPDPEIRKTMRQRRQSYSVSLDGTPKECIE